MPRKGRQVIIARGIARRTISGSRKTTTSESSPPSPPSLCPSRFLPFPFWNQEYAYSSRNFPRKEEKSGGRIEVVVLHARIHIHTHTHTHGCAKRGSRYMPRPSTRTVAGLDLVVGVRACTPCAIRGNGGGGRMERVDERGVRPEHVTPDSYTDCCYGINL